MFNQHASNNYSLADVDQTDSIFTFLLCLAGNGKIYLNTCILLCWKGGRKKFIYLHEDSGTNDQLNAFIFGSVFFPQG